MATIRKRGNRSTQNRTHIKSEHRKDIMLTANK